MVIELVTVLRSYIEITQLDPSQSKRPAEIQKKPMLKKLR